MDDLAALKAAIIDAPTDRTVRLVYADALDESGDPSRAARAAFIRAQIELEAIPDNGARRTALIQRCDDLFAEHWIGWWRPVCAAVGLPEPYVPKHRLRDRAEHAVRREGRPLGAPYERASDCPGAYSITSDQHNFTAQFIGGFPELLYFRIAEPGNLACWAEAIPLTRLRFAMELGEDGWNLLDGPHLARVAELAFDRLPYATACDAASSPHVRRLTALKALSLGRHAATVRALVHNPTWTGLQSLTLTGVTPPDAIQALAQHCTLELESLSLAMSEVPEPPTTTGFTGAIGAMLSEVLTRFFSSHPLPPGPIRWPDYWPALAALARAPVMRHLSMLQVTDAGPSSNFIGGLLARLELTDAPAVLDPDAVFPDALARSLADGLNRDRLVRLELPAARLSPVARADLIHRFGPRFVPA